MKLDRTKSYGTVTGHPSAQFEQDGILFNGAGEELSDEVKKKNLVDSVTSNMDRQAVKEFLQQILAEGAMSKNKVYKEVENANMSWEAVQEAVTTLGVRHYRQGSTDMWKLPDVA